MVGRDREGLFSDWFLMRVENTDGIQYLSEPVVFLDYDNPYNRNWTMAYPDMWLSASPDIHTKP